MKLSNDLLYNFLREGKHKTTKNRKGQLYRMQTVIVSDRADDANQKLTKTIIHRNR